MKDLTKTTLGELLSSKDEIVANHAIAIIKRKQLLCDNTDCEGQYNEVVRTKMKDEFDGDWVDWCEPCRQRDKSFIA